MKDLELQSSKTWLHGYMNAHEPGIPSATRAFSMTPRGDSSTASGATYRGVAPGVVARTSGAGLVQSLPVFSSVRSIWCPTPGRRTAPARSRRHVLDAASVERDISLRIVDMPDIVTLYYCACSTNP